MTKKNFYEFFRRSNMMGNYAKIDFCEQNSQKIENLYFSRYFIANCFIGFVLLRRLIQYPSLSKSVNK